MARYRRTKEERARLAARRLQAHGDTRPFMVILKQERDRLGIITPPGKGKQHVETIRSALL